jgi:chromosomal replication initiation ATPase DnaA
MRKAGIFQKSDERILGDGQFVEAVLTNAQETLSSPYLLAAKGIRFDHLIEALSELLSIQPQKLVGPSKERAIVKGRALLCFWAVHELGMSMTTVSGRLKIAVPTVSVAVRKGERIVRDEGLALMDVLNIKI